MSENSPDHPHAPPTDVEYPDELHITSKPFDDSRADTLDRVDQWEQGEDVPHVVNFQDVSRLQRILTDRRIELIRHLMDEPAESIRALASRLDRDVRQIHDDLQLLSEYRIVHFQEEGGAKQPFVPYERVVIEVELTKESGKSSGSAASA